jgi:geranylgeranyl reductase family protein
VAALVLARAGARVGLVDKAAFPRDKACGDIVGPRGLQVLGELAVPLPRRGCDIGDILVLGPTGRRVRLPSDEGLTYPGHGTVVTRVNFDALLHDAAVEEGATPIRGRADEPLWHEGRLEGYRIEGGGEVRADFVIGADGATSHVARTAGLVDTRRVLWGFAVRSYVPSIVDLPVICFWEPSSWRAFPGYGWAFPGADGGANIGIGLALLADRRSSARVARALPAFLAHLHRHGVLTDGTREGAGHHMGGWLKMGMVGTVPADERVLLVGDAAGLINPLQGEGIAQALASGRLAADAIVHAPGNAVGRYRAGLQAAHLPYHRVAAALQAATVGHPQLVAGLSRLLMVAARIDAVAGGWSIFWNELLDGAPPNRHRAVARAITRVGRIMSSPTPAAAWFAATLPADGRGRPRLGVPSGS